MLVVICTISQNGKEDSMGRQIWSMRHDPNHLSNAQITPYPQKLTHTVKGCFTQESKLYKDNFICKWVLLLSLKFQ
jgi:hypothetical protein